MHGASHASAAVGFRNFRRGAAALRHGHVEGDNEADGERVEDRDEGQHEPLDDVVGFGVKGAGHEAI